MEQFYHFREMSFTSVVFLGFKVILTEICRHCWIRFYLKRQCCCFFVSQKLHFNMKTQTHYCNNHNRTVFSTLPDNVLIHQFLCSVNNHSSACYHEHIFHKSYNPR